MSDTGQPTPSIAAIWEQREGYRDISFYLKDSCEITRRHLGRSYAGLEHKLQNHRLVSQVNSFLRFSVFNPETIAEETPVVCKTVDGVFELGRNGSIATLMFDEGELLWGIAYGVMTMALPSAETNRIAVQNGIKRVAAEIFSPVLLLDYAVCYAPDPRVPGSFTATELSPDAIAIPLEYDLECIGTVPVTGAQ